jgi:hypothetical protein
MIAPALTSEAKFTAGPEENMFFINSIMVFVFIRYE